jgi:rubrerythrin
MNKQVKLYSISLGMVKTKEERRLSTNKFYIGKAIIQRKNEIVEQIKKELGVEKWTTECKTLNKEYKAMDECLISCKKVEKNIKTQLHDELLKYEGVREIESKYFRKSNTIAVFDNVLTRTLKLSDSEETTLDFIVIEKGKQDDILMEQVINNGLKIDGTLYRFFTAGAGQTRQKKWMMIKEDLWNEHQEILMCGLTLDIINNLGGMNTNKFLCYLSLNNSASDVIENFDIDKCIVVEDMETIVEDEEVDYISMDDKVPNGVTTYKKVDKEIERKLYKTEWKVKPQKMNVPIPTMDGCGLCLPSFNKKNNQIRAPFIKGLLSPTNFVKYANKAGNTKVKDIYGKEYDIIEDEIMIIFTKSQFKLWSYYKNEVDENGNDILDENGNIKYSGWDRYKESFKLYECTANLCKEDEDDYKDMTINYQMLQTLTNMTDEQIELLTGDFKELIKKVHSDRDSQLKFLGATLDNNKRDYFEEILRLYPEMLTSAFVKKKVSDTITSEKIKAKSGKLKIKAKRTFMVPDLVAFMDWLFNGTINPVGALKKNEVYCNLYKNDSRLGVLRSPHASREWILRTNARVEKKNEYFPTDAIYIGSHDLITLVLTNDSDGDEALVVSSEEKWLLDLAEKQMEEIRPLFYEMGKAGAQLITTQNIFKSLKFAYEKGNIGKISNTITEIWSKDDYEKNMDNIKKLCAYNNLVIDSAKTLSVPKIPTEIKDLIKNRKYPYFFQFAKGKEEDKCLPIGNGVMDRICKSIDKIEYTKFIYHKSFGSFRTSKLMNNSKIEIDMNIIDMYLKLEKKTNDLMVEYKKKADEDEDVNNTNYRQRAYEDARKDMVEYAKSNNIEYSDMIDMIIKWSFKGHDLRLAFVFEVFGAVIINNLNKNLKKSLDNGFMMCDCCGKRVKTEKNKKYCPECSTERTKIRNRDRKKKNV